MKKLAIAALVLLVMNCSTDNVLSEEAQLKKDVDIIDRYLDKNGITAVKDPSGLRYVLHATGTGTSPILTSKLTVIYKGIFLSGGAVFDESDIPPKQFTTPLSNLIPGWQIGFQYVGKGGKATFYIPSGLAYGRAGSGIIPTNSNLIFEVELVGFSL